MTIVRRSPSSKIQKRSSFQIKKTPNTMKTIDVFSNSQLPGLKNKENTISEIESEYNSDEQDGDEIDIYSHTVTDNNKYKYKESESQEPKEELQELFAAIQNRLKKKTNDQKRKMEVELKKTINRTVNDMVKKMNIIKDQIDLKLVNMKTELESIQKDRENHLKSLKKDYETFQKVIEKSIERIDLGEKRIHDIREKFITEIATFNRDFDFPKEKIEEIFNLALKETKSFTLKNLK